MLWPYNNFKKLGPSSKKTYSEKEEKEEQRKSMKQVKRLVIGGKTIPKGKTIDVALPVSESYSGTQVSVLVRVIRSMKDGPILFLTGAVHGDELNGTGIIREIMNKSPKLVKGTLICVPVSNIFGFENHSRYLPDRRDLNRSFPGIKSGNLANRLAYVIFNEVIKNCDFGIDLHTAAVRRTNFPQIRTDLSVKGTKLITEAFGCEIIIDKKAHPNSLRSTACAIGCPTILYEAGEVMKFEPGIIKLGLRGVYNVMRYLGMISGKKEIPKYQTITKKTTWVRADSGGLLHFHVKPGDLVKKGDVLATCETLFSNQSQSVIAPAHGHVIGMTTLPAVKPGEPVCHLAKADIPVVGIKKLNKSAKTLHRRVQMELATNFSVSKKARRLQNE